ncbi:MAG: hypothetical protein V4819_20285 [Verrucomicrobiota bacterium]
MKSLIRQLLILGFSIGIVSADGGIPVDLATHSVKVPHTLLTVSESQREEIDVVGTLTLTPDQWKELRAIGPDCPKRIDRILLETYDDCGCDLIDVFYAIQLNTGAVAVTHDQLSSGWGFRKLQLALSESDTLQLRVDPRGQFYHEGILIPFPRLLDLVKASSKKPRADGIILRKIGVVRPTGVSRKDAAVADRLETLFKTAEAAGWEQWFLTKEDVEEGLR